MEWEKPMSAAVPHHSTYSIACEMPYTYLLGGKSRDFRVSFDAS